MNVDLPAHSGAGAEAEALRVPGQHRGTAYPPPLTLFYSTQLLSSRVGGVLILTTLGECQDGHGKGAMLLIAFAKGVEAGEVPAKLLVDEGQGGALPGTQVTQKSPAAFQQLLHFFCHFHVN